MGTGYDPREGSAEYQVSPDSDSGVRLEESGDRRADAGLLSSVVENDVVPRLIASGFVAERLDRARPENGGALPDLDAEAFVGLLLHSERGTCVAHLRDLSARGHRLEALYLDLLAPAARLLGPMWLEDRLSFVEVSVALARLQALIVKLSRADFSAFPDPDPKRSIVLAHAQGEGHSLGLQLVAEFFRLAGWTVAGGPGVSSGAELRSLLRNDAFAAVGLSAGSHEKALDLVADVAAARRTARRPDFVLLVGGAAFVADPELWRQLNSDAMASDGLHAVREAERLLDAQD